MKHAKKKKLKVEWLRKRPTVRLEWISPEQAKRYLKNQAPNRRLKKESVPAMARLARAGRFPPTLLMFDTLGRMIDGQHRMQMVIDLGCAAPFVVMRGVPRVVQEELDRGHVRQPATCTGRKVRRARASRRRLSAWRTASSLRTGARSWRRGSGSARASRWRWRKTAGS